MSGCLGIVLGCIVAVCAVAMVTTKFLVIGRAMLGDGEVICQGQLTYSLLFYLGVIAIEGCVSDRPRHDVQSEFPALLKTSYCATLEQHLRA